MAAATEPPAAASQASRPMQARLARLGFGLGAHVPFRVSHALGGALGGLAYLVPGRTRHVTRVNLELCFPELSAAERARLGRRSTAADGRLAFELGGMWRWPRERVLSLVREVEGDELFEAGLAAGKGLLLITPHFGSWEMVGMYVGARAPLTALYKPPRIRELEQFYTSCRQHLGAKLVRAGPSGVGALVKALRRGELAGVLPDQDPGPGAGVFAPFFGVAANTSVLVPRLLRRTGAAAVFIVAERLAGGRGFRIRFSPAPEPMWGEDLVAAASAMNAALEGIIQRRPEQYLWSYKRFRVQPPGVRNPYL